MSGNRLFTPPTGSEVRRILAGLDLSTSDAAQWCDVSPRTVRKWISSPAPNCPPIPWTCLDALTRTIGLEITRAGWRLELARAGILPRP